MSIYYLCAFRQTNKINNETRAFSFWKLEWSIIAKIVGLWQSKKTIKSNLKIKL